MNNLQEEYKQNKKLIRASSWPYKRYMSKDDRYTCELYGLYKAVSSFNPKMSDKRTWINRKVKFECLKFLRQERRFSKKHELYGLIYPIKYKEKKHSLFELSDLAGIDLELIRDIYVYDRTISEVATKRNTTYHKIKFLLKKTRSLIKQQLSGV